MTRIPAQGIPGLLRVCSPVQTEWGAFVVVAIEGDQYTIQSRESAGMPVPVRAEFLALDLTDPTGRWHAGRWASTRPDGDATEESDNVLDGADWGEDMTPEQIETLAALVLRLAHPEEGEET